MHYDEQPDIVEYDVQINASLVESDIEQKRHGKLVPKKTPQIGLSNVNWIPRIRVTEWLNHTSKMLVFEWFPLSYFTLAAIISPIDPYGCAYYANYRIDKLMMFVFAPILFFRFLGLLFMTKPHLIIF